MNLVFDASDFRALADYWQRAPQITREELVSAITDADQLLKGELMQALPSGASGAGGLRGSIQTSEFALADNVIGQVATDRPYAPHIEFGTKPHMPPIQPLLDWVVARLGLHDDEAEGAAWGIARKIAREGTKPNPVWQDVWSANQGEIAAKLRMAVTRIASRLAQVPA